MVEQFLASVAVSYFTAYSRPAIEKLFRTAFNLKPEIEKQADEATSSQDVEALFQEVVGVIDAHASRGTIDIDKVLLSALRRIRFDHEAGSVTISGSTLSAPVLVTGGGKIATGKRTIRDNTTLKSAGTQIDIGQGASIEMTGGAQIIQN